ncbi:cell division protein SepF [Leptotrichia sp. OH3620_COT-345]|uniref:cell division protein SepF n=1 Tax=Leptotrichia sp. OH3620_COT-345 TaxID=2491048 RepID=UPI0034CD821D
MNKQEVANLKLGKKFLEFFGDVDEDEIVEEEEREVVVKPKTQVKTHSYTEPEHTEEKEKKVMSIFGGGKKEESGKMKVSYVSIIRPKTFEDSRLIADSIKEKKVVTFSLEFLEFEVGQRVIDFVSGAAYAMDAHLSKVTDKVLTSIPNGVGYEDIDTSLEEEKNRNGNLL